MSSIQWGMIVAAILAPIIVGLALLPLFWTPARGRHRR